ncbi:hypothetical protein WDU99_13775 [Microbacterium sp. Mu-80]|uniref:Uncharacterized protein n=1 Tax=Microbacterium bandirmense TaxID=3122050 RepID=A0ABU8LED8_9MICO
MALKYLGGTLPSFGVYAIVSGMISRIPTGTWELNAETVESVDIAGAGKEYNYAAGGAGMMAGAIVAGPVGMLVGGLAPKAFKKDVVQFVIRFRDGNVAHFAGSPGDYKRALKSSYRPTLATSQPMQADAADTSEKSEVEKLREEVAALRSAQQRPSAPLSKEPGSAPVSKEPKPAPVPKEPKPAPVPKERKPPSRVWFEDFPAPSFEPPVDGESTEEKRRRESVNKKQRKAYLAALKEHRKRFEREIRKSTMNPVKRFEMISEMHTEYFELQKP